MAGNKVTLTFAGDSKDLEQTFDKVTSSTERTTTTIRESGGKFRDLQDRFDAIDQGAMGFRDTITGVQDGWKGLTDDSLTMNERLLLVGTGVGDLASGFSNLIVPLASLSLQQMKTTATMVAGWASTAASAVASVATQVASWVVLGAQSLVSAAQVALAWLISMGPIILVIAAVVGLVIVIIKNWDTIKAVIAAGWNWVKSTTSSVWNAITSFLAGVWGRIKATVTGQINAVKAIVSGVWNGIKAVTSAVWSGITSSIRTQINIVKGIFNAFKSVVGRIFSAIGDRITAPIRSALNGIKSAWNNSIGGKGISIPSVMGFGGASFTIPRLAKGGIVTSPTLAMIGEGRQSEAVIPLDRLGQMGSGTTVIELRSGGSRLDDLLLEVLRRALDARGIQVLG